MKKSSGFIKSFWQGEWSLVQTFWGYGVVGNIVLGIPVIYWEDSFKSLSDGVNMLFSIYNVFYFVFFVWVLVGIWRSATNYAKKKKLWGGLAKIYVFLNVLNLVVQIFVIN